MCIIEFFVWFFLFMSFEPFFTYLHSYYLNFWLLHQCVSLSNLSFIMEAKLDILGLDTFSLRIFEWKFNVEDYIYKLTMFPKYRITFYVIHKQNGINYFRYFFLQVLFFYVSKINMPIFFNRILFYIVWHSIYIYYSYLYMYLLIFLNKW